MSENESKQVTTDEKEKEKEFEGLLNLVTLMSPWEKSFILKAARVYDRYKNDSEFVEVFQYFMNSSNEE